MVLPKLSRHFLQAKIIVPNCPAGRLAGTMACVRRRGNGNAQRARTRLWLAGRACRDHATFSCPEQDNKLLRRVFRARRARAHIDVVASRNKQRARTCHGWLAALAVTMGHPLVLSRTINCSGGFAVADERVPTATPCRAEARSESAHIRAGWPRRP